MSTPGVRRADRTPENPVRAAWDRFFREAKRQRKAWRGCEACPPERRDPNAWLEIHHVISQQRIKRYARDEKLPSVRRLALLTDPRNSIVLCRSCHHRHTVRHERLSLGVIPAPAWEYAKELGLKGELIEEYGP